MSWDNKPVLLMAVGVSITLRAAAAVYLGNAVAPLPGIFDQLSYHALALRVLDGHGFSFGTGWWPATPANAPTAHWSFVYVLYLAAVYLTAGPYPLVARLVQAVVVGALQPLLTYRVAARMFGTRVGVAAAWIAAGYAYFVYYSAALLTESFYIAAILWSVDRALALGAPVVRTARERALLWLQLGLALAAAVLLRQVILVTVPIILVWAWWNASRHSATLRPAAGRRWSSLAWASGAAFIVVAAMLPWTVRNWVAFSQIVPLNTNAGFAFYWGNHPIHGTHFVPILPDVTYGQLIPEDLRGLNEAALDRALLRRGMAIVADDPARFVLLSISRITEYVKFWPTRDSGRASNFARVLSFGICLPFMLTGVTIALLSPSAHVNPGVIRDRSASGLVLAVILLYALVHLLSWTLVRYRLPLDALLIPYAALSMVRMRDHARVPGQARVQNRVTT